jgi:thymidine kinase
MAERGWIHVICGPMFSGKTEALLKTVRRLEIAGKRIFLYKPEIDTRTTFIASRNGLQLPSETAKSSREIASVGISLLPDVIAIDEAQFFDDDLPSVVGVLADRGIFVIVSGLDRDFLKRPFGPMAGILSQADSIDKLTAVCFVCKGEASLTQRLVHGIPASADDPLIVVGGINDDKYEARCRKCWELG